MQVHGIHHVTAVSADIVRNLEFYTGTLGLRLVKKSVNQDDVKAYHLFYADKVATPGTDLTFFDWPTIGGNLPGGGTVALTTLRVAGVEALDWWEKRFREAGMIAERGEDVLGREQLTFGDPEGQRLELVDDTGLPGEFSPWTKVIPEEMATRGILGVDIESMRPEGTYRVLTELLGFESIESGIIEVLQVKTKNSVGQIRLDSRPGRGGRVGAGGVHHVAFRVKDDDELTAYKERMDAIGLPNSGFVDRFYFHSLYFREPGGVLFELATDGPGMQADEDIESLGEHLALPPFLEDSRAEIEQNLKPLPSPA